MGIIYIYNEEDNSRLQINVELKYGFLASELASANRSEYYLEITPNFRKANGSAFNKFVVRTLTDVAPGATTPATDFQELIDDYVDYFMTAAEMALSSSSSSTSSSSSSEGYSSSSSSSSSSEGTSSSSSSSEGTSSSSSSEGTSSSSSSS